ncbi:hypothetical protein VNO77_22671 [Canavalia gladiata]|uniref:Uncharacterized protein n=1 Tax=Canavalia gladiata TaxID=3824 RepID=A0AAN9L309_CANGL
MSVLHAISFLYVLPTSLERLPTHNHSKEKPVVDVHNSHYEISIAWEVLGAHMPRAANIHVNLDSAINLRATAIAKTCLEPSPLTCVFVELNLSIESPNLTLDSFLALCLVNMMNDRRTTKSDQGTSSHVAKDKTTTNQRQLNFHPIEPAAWDHTQSPLTTQQQTSIILVASWLKEGMRFISVQWDQNFSITKALL